MCPCHHGQLYYGAQARYSGPSPKQGECCQGAESPLHSLWASAATWSLAVTWDTAINIDLCLYRATGRDITLRGTKSGVITMASNSSAGYSHQAVPHHPLVSSSASLHSSQTIVVLSLPTLQHILVHHSSNHLPTPRGDFFSVSGGQEQAGETPSNGGKHSETWRRMVTAIN